MSSSRFGVLYDPKKNAFLVVKDKPELGKENETKLFKNAGGSLFHIEEKTAEGEKIGLQREYLEETGLVVKVGDQMYATDKKDFKDPDGPPHKIVFSEVTPIGGTLEKGDEIDVLEWMPLDAILWELGEYEADSQKYYRRKFLPAEKIPKNTFFVDHLKALGEYIKKRILKLDEY